MAYKQTGSLIEAFGQDKLLYKDCFIKVDQHPNPSYADNCGLFSIFAQYIYQTYGEDFPLNVFMNDKGLGDKLNAIAMNIRGKKDIDIDAIVSQIVALRDEVDKYRGNIAEISKKLVDDFLKNRKLKKLSNTETALKSLLKKIDSMPEDNNSVFKFIVEKGWGGFEKKWYYDEVERNQITGKEEKKGELDSSR